MRQYVLENATEEVASRSSDRQCSFGYTPSGDYIIVVYENVDEVEPVRLPFLTGEGDAKTKSSQRVANTQFASQLALAAMSRLARGKMFDGWGMPSLRSGFAGTGPEYLLIQSLSRPASFANFFALASNVRNRLLPIVRADAT
jgi:hypothetical protein